MTRPELTRREHLVELLKRYPETMPAFGSSGGGDGSGVLEMPRVWHERPVQELVRCLGRLREEDGVACRHLVGRYCGERVQLRCRRRGGRLEGLPIRSEPAGAPVQVEGERSHGYAVLSVVVLTWGPWVNPALVERGLDFLEVCYRGEPMLPQAMVAG